MAFRSLPMLDSLPIFPTRAQIQEYLILYAKTFDLYPYIKFNTSVRRLSYSKPVEARRWSIEYVGEEGCSEIQVDYVCCSNGHYEDGWIPSTPGLRYVFNLSSEKGQQKS
jgi:cation diffusion facilitator CzcD-associated flavoprotein CzcO